MQVLDGALAVVDIDTLWRNKATGVEMHWFGRTGKMFASHHFGVEADIITSAKSLAGGLPLGAVTGTDKIMDAVHPGGLGGTYGGNPLACRAALAVLTVIEEEKLKAGVRALCRKFFL